MPSNLKYDGDTPRLDLSPSRSGLPGTVDSGTVGVGVAGLGAGNSAAGVIGGAGWLASGEGCRPGVSSAVLTTGVHQSRLSRFCALPKATVIGTLQS